MPAGAGAGGKLNATSRAAVKTVRSAPVSTSTVSVISVD
jgi:hypothetical protein